LSCPAAKCRGSCGQGPRLKPCPKAPSRRGNNETRRGNTAIRVSGTQLRISRIRGAGFRVGRVDDASCRDWAIVLHWRAGTTILCAGRGPDAHSARSGQLLDRQYRLFLMTPPSVCLTFNILPYRLINAPANLPPEVATMGSVHVAAYSHGRPLGCCSVSAMPYASGAGCATRPSEVETAPRSMLLRCSRDLDPQLAFWCGGR